MNIFVKKNDMYQTLLSNLESGIYTITINRPDKLNALNKDLFTDLNAAIDEIESNNDNSKPIKFWRVSNSKDILK